MMRAHVLFESKYRDLMVFQGWNKSSRIHWTFLTPRAAYRLILRLWAATVNSKVPRKLWALPYKLYCVLRTVPLSAKLCFLCVCVWNAPTFTALQYSDNKTHQRLPSIHHCSMVSAPVCVQCTLISSLGEFQNIRTGSGILGFRPCWCPLSFLFAFHISVFFILLHFRLNFIRVSSLRLMYLHPSVDSSLNHFLIKWFSTIIIFVYCKIDAERQYAYRMITE